jgi:iron-regulated transporter 1
LLQVPKNVPSHAAATEALEPTQLASPKFVPGWIYTLYESLKFYYQHRVFLPSFALALLYLTVLGFEGQMVTYLISAGYNSFHIALARTLSVIFELSATWLAPRLMKRIDPARAGMWFLSWQMMWLGAAVSFFWAQPVAIIAASGLVAGTILSRIGLWGYDLCAQFIIQEVSATVESYSCAI